MAAVGWFEHFRPRVSLEPAPRAFLACVIGGVLKKNRPLGTRFDDHFRATSNALSVTFWIFEMSIEVFLKY